MHSKTEKFDAFSLVFCRRNGKIKVVLETEKGLRNMFDFKFDWDRTMETGLADVDTQHKQLFKIGRDLEQLLRIQCIGVTDKQLLDIVCELRDFTAYHFYVEERMMDEMSYPRITEHKKYHKRCSDFITGLDLPKIKAQPMEELKKIRDEVQEWIMNHVLSEDCKMTTAYKKYQKEEEERANKVEVPAEEKYGRFLKEYDVVKVYLYKNQDYKGHLVAVFKESAKELSKLSALERNLYFADVSKAAKVLKKCYNPDAICYMDLEDMSDKLVSHIIPKYKEDGNYGVFPNIDFEAEYTNASRYEAIYEKMKQAF
ncbi:MAG: hemerythrin domain-containing protein [Lachnospiraceae bacterium]|nr:hemerythrin domain-containing protein [Lachnospiraceae bacterium]